MTKPRKGQAPPQLTRVEFRRRFEQSFYDPAFEKEKDAIGRLEAIAWDGYDADRKWPRTRKAGRGFADPKFELSVEWLETRKRLRAAEKRQKNRSTRSRVLVICGSSRNDGTCPGEMSKTYRLAKIAEETLKAEKIEVDFLDLSLLSAEFSRRIYPCKACVSTAQPLCHWPCTCYPNHALGQSGDWMAEIYPKWVAAHGVMILCPVNWYQAPSTLKLMIDRLVCADGGNPDPTSTGGKDAERAKELELAGWPYPRHLAGRTFAVVVHGDAAGAETLRR